MSDDMESFMFTQSPTPERPLQGLTVLLVEDSRFASEAIRLLCLRSGARIRRADTLCAAHRHLRVYRPTVVIADVGLPDGSGADLIKELTSCANKVPVVLGMSGDETVEDLVMAAGADGFLAKPVENLASFQQAIIRHLPEMDAPRGPRELSSEVVHPDRLALQDDLTHAAAILRADADVQTQDYLARFIGGVARTAHDDVLEAAANELVSACAQGEETSANLKRVAGEVESRLTEIQAL